ncbi:hypothetical protein ACU686_32670 [Yinghuangia aomiensis]
MGRPRPAPGDAGLGSGLVIAQPGPHPRVRPAPRSGLQRRRPADRAGASAPPSASPSSAPRSSRLASQAHPDWSGALRLGLVVSISFVVLALAIAIGDLTQERNRAVAASTRNPDPIRRFRRIAHRSWSYSCPRSKSSSMRVLRLAACVTRGREGPIPMVVGNVENQRLGAAVPALSSEVIEAALYRAAEGEPAAQATTYILTEEGSFVRRPDLHAVCLDWSDDGRYAAVRWDVLREIVTAEDSAYSGGRAARCCCCAARCGRRARAAHPARRTRHGTGTDRGARDAHRHREAVPGRGVGAGRRIAVHSKGETGLLDGDFAGRPTGGRS